MNTAAFALPFLYKALLQFAKNIFAKECTTTVDEPLSWTKYSAYEAPVVCTQSTPTILTPRNTTDRLHKPVRVVLVLEAGQSRSDVGRMVISGRMADVCAELDRLASLEVA